MFALDWTQIPCIGPPRIHPMQAAEISAPYLPELQHREEGSRACVRD